MIDQASENHQPILISGKRHNAVLVSAEIFPLAERDLQADDWAAIQETMYLLSVPGMRESIREGLSTPVDECAKELDW